MSLASRFRSCLFSISPDETSFARRGFEVAEPRVQHHLEQVGRTFVEGYHMALAETAAQRLAVQLGEVESQWRGFAFEGAAMGLALVDSLVPWKSNRFADFLAGPGAAHAYMVHVGFGWAAARVPWLRRNIVRHTEKFDPLLRWLILDGYGFHQAFFHAEEHIQRQAVPRQLSGYSRRAFDQGLGRCLWFVAGADSDRIAATIGAFAPQRRADLWSGIGLACTYAGGVDRSAIDALAAAEPQYQLDLAQGAAFAAKARQRAANMGAHTELACEVLCGMSADEAAAITDECLPELPCDDAQPAYEHWRRRIREELARRKILEAAPLTSVRRSES